MESVSYSKKPNIGKSPSMYDDVFTSSQKFSSNSLAPRLEDYSEIFGGFHGSRGRSSSIPVLDLPPLDAVAVSSSDYSDVFTEFHGLQFAVSFQDLLTQANNAGYESSDQAWYALFSRNGYSSPAHSGSLSDETDPSAFSERSQSTSTGDIHHSVNGINQFNLSYHKAHQRSDGDVTAGMTHVTHLHAVPGYTCIVEEKVESENSKDEKRLYQGINDPNYKEDYGMRVADDKSYTENLSLPVNNNFQKRGSRLNSWETRSKSGPILNEPLITVSDISLRTRPSHLPPPSRPPPVLAFGKREHEITHLKPKTSRSMSVASLEDALCRTEGNVTKDEGLQTFMNLQMEDDIKYWSCHKDGRESYTETPFDFGNNTAGHADQWSQAEVTLLGTRKERKETMNTREVGSDGIYGEIEINSNEKSWKEKKHRKNRTSSLGSYKNEEIGLKNEEIGLWREAAEYFEVETDYCSKYYKDSKEKTIGNKDKKSFGDQWDRKAATKQNKSCEKDELAEMAPEREEKQDILYKGESSVEYVPAPEREEKQDILYKGESSVEYVPEEGRSRESSRSIFQMEDKKSVQVIIGIIEPETSKEEQRVVDEEIKKVLYTAESMETSNEDDSQHENVTDTDLDRKLASERTERVSDANSEKGNEMVSEEVFEIDHLMNRNYESEKTDLENKVKDIQDIEERENLQNELLRRPKKMQKGTHVRLGPKTSELVEQKDEDCSIRHVCNQVDVHHVHDQYKKGSQFSLTREEENNMINECHKLEEKEMELQRSCKQDNFGTEQREAHQFENGEKLGAGPGTKFYEMRSLEVMDQERTRTSSSRDFCEEGSQSNSTEASVVIMKKNMGEDTCLDETSTQKAKQDELKKNVTNEGSDRSRTSTLETNEKLTDDVPSMEEVFRPVKGRLNMPDKNLGFSRQVNNSKIAANTVEQVHPVSPTASINVSEKPFNNVAKILPHTVASDHQVKVTYPKAQRAECIAGMQVTVDDKVQMEKLKKPQLASEWVDNAKNISDALQTVLVDIGDIRDGYETKSTQGTETKANNVRVKTSRNDGELKHENLVTTKEEKKRQKEREKDVISKTEKAGGHDEHLKRSEEEREREREREKDRTAVENTNREARGRAYNDAREKAALERATSEARQRAMAEARERLEKASAEAREARIKAERAAVERATAEARQRAFEKVKAAKCNPEANDRLYRAADKSASKEMKQSGPTNDSYNIQRQNELRDTNSSAQGVEGESPQRCKARMERYQRTAERAAKALAEKNMRDFVAQREQEERARLAEVLDADVKRWSSGKQGNLRALLSTLQYILGPDSGWQPIPLTEVITSAAVKKVYRKATLCVHPDKLQQRGANTQQKYICEKVFDLLKEAWNKFNSEER